jgi:hypothetical protein
MTLSEIYRLSPHYFELKVRNEIPRYGICYDQYHGAVLRENGTKIFTIKEDDRWTNYDGQHSNYCEVCGTNEEENRPYMSRLGPYWHENHTGYVRPHP